MGMERKGKKRMQWMNEGRNEGNAKTEGNEKEKSVWARAKRTMKTKLEVDGVELQAEPQAKCPHSVWPGPGVGVPAGTS